MPGDDGSVKGVPVMRSSWALRPVPLPVKVLKRLPVPQWENGSFVGGRRSCSVMVPFSPGVGKNVEYVIDSTHGPTTGCPGRGNGQKGGRPKVVVCPAASVNGALGES